MDDGVRGVKALTLGITLGIMVKAGVPRVPYRLSDNMVDTLFELCTP